MTFHTENLGTPFIPVVSEIGVTVTTTAFEKAFGKVIFISVMVFALQVNPSIVPACGKLLCHRNQYTLLRKYIQTHIGIIFHFNVC